MFNSEIFGKRVKKMIEDQNTTQDAIAKSIHISPKTLSQLVTGKQKVSADILFQLADKLHVSVEYLAGSSDSLDEGMTCKAFCRIITELADCGQLSFSTVKQDEEVCGPDERGEWSASQEQLEYAAIIFPRHEKLYDPNPGDTNWIQANAAINDFLTGLSQTLSLMNKTNSSEKLYQRFMEALLEDVPGELPLFRKRRPTS